MFINRTNNRCWEEPWERELIDLKSRWISEFSRQRFNRGITNGFLYIFPLFQKLVFRSRERFEMFVVFLGIGRWEEVKSLEANER